MDSWSGVLALAPAVSANQRLAGVFFAEVMEGISVAIADWGVRDEIVFCTRVLGFISGLPFA